MKSITLIRKIVRTAFAVYFWLRPLILFSNLRFPASWHESYARILPEALLLLFITYYALLAEGGWLSVAYDLFFVYFWPLFVVWFFVKYATGKAYRKLKQTTFYKELNGACSSQRNLDSCPPIFSVHPALGATSSAYIERPAHLDRTCGHYVRRGGDRSKP